MRFLLAVLFLSATLAAIPAFAEHPTDIEVKFQQLDVGVERGELTVSYAIAPNDWQEMRAAKIQPRLNLFTPANRRRAYDFRYSLPLTDRRGTVTFPREIKLRGSKLVELQVVGFSGYYHVARTSFGERCDERVRVRVRRGRQGRGHGQGYGHNPHQGGPHKGEEALLVEACGEASKMNVSDCIKLASKLDRRFAVQTVEACGAHSSFPSDLNSCLDRARKFTHFSPAPSVLACGESTQFTSDMNRCLDRAARHDREPSRVIAACDEATQFSSDFNKCIDNSRELGRRAEHVIEACDQNSRWRSDFHTCVEVSARTRRT